MTRNLLAVSVVLLLSACATAPVGAYNQAVMPSPVVAPPITYVSPPGGIPGATPAGTGLGEPRSPDWNGREVPRSPNKRILPATKEPGLWAADTVKATANDAPTLYGVAIPYPDNAVTTEDRAAVGACVGTMNDAARETQQTAVIAAYPEDVRRCLAAHAYYHCASEMYSFWEKMKEKAVRYEADVLERHGKMVNHAHELVTQWCFGVDTTDEHDRAGVKVEMRWDKTMDLWRKP